MAINSKTNNLNPVIITTASNSTLNCMVDVMERMLNATAAPSVPTTSLASPPIINSSIEVPQPSSASTLSPVEILDQVVRIILGVDSLLAKDQLLSASLFFTSALDDAICATCTFTADNADSLFERCSVLNKTNQQRKELLASTAVEV